MIRILNLLLLVGVVALSIGLYDVKYRAQQAEREADRLDRQIAREQEAIKVLRAEWAHLNEPDRLQALAKRYTGLRPVSPGQIGRFEDVPMPRRTDEFYVPRGQSLGGVAGIQAGGSMIR
ncbi:cell division protein FtsL [Parvibaculum indicum]|uniref:cell division protein FtsL n=1 Tax=Parvibaculum indicum TaxID=562969 RepID=UPI00141F71C7|nr:cell division protein FtsL [Parvibaculum indicum]NIJ40994.1 cell division protein FtsL [Parvibaculum indicum]